VLQQLLQSYSPQQYFLLHVIQLYVTVLCYNSISQPYFFIACCNYMLSFCIITAFHNRIFFIACCNYMLPFCIITASHNLIFLLLVNIICCRFVLQEHITTIFFYCMIQLYIVVLYYNNMLRAASHLTIHNHIFFNRILCSYFAPVSCDHIPFPYFINHIF
jgi:hypothetical protein